MSTRVEKPSLPSAADVRRTLRNAGDRMSAARAKELMPGVLSVFGAPMSVVTKLAGELTKLGKIDPEPLLATLDALWAAGSLEERQLVGKVLERLAKRHPAECFAAIERYLPSLDCWTNCDNLACFAMKDIALANPDDAVRRCGRWAKDDNRWIRRFGVVVLRAFEKAEAPRGVFAVLDSFRDEVDPDVQKGVVWMLRSFCDHDRDEVLALLTRWAATASGDRARMIRDGMKKLPAAAQTRLKQRLASR